MRVLLVDGYGIGDPDGAVVAAAIETLESTGHQVHHVALAKDGFQQNMSEAERVAYHTDSPLITEETQESAAAVAAADALLFCYPTTTFTVPALLKGWLDRVLVVGVAFVFNSKHKVKPGMKNIVRLGVITTTPHSKEKTRRARDGGRRTILWGLRLSCHRFCRRTFVSLPSGGDEYALVNTSLHQW